MQEKTMFSPVEDAEILINLPLKKFEEKRKQAVTISQSLERLKYKSRAYRMSECGTYLKFGIEKNKSSHLIGANFCRDRLCPLCAWRQSCKDFFLLSSALDIIFNDSSYEAIFLTLTIKNPPPEQLRQTLKDMSSAWNRINSNKKIKKFVYGYYKATEITYNAQANTFHPHFHVIMIVKSDYFSGKDYLPHKKWVKLWKQALLLDYSPSVNIKRIKHNERLRGAVKEVSKYILKSTDLIKSSDKLTDKVVGYLANDIKGFRFTAAGGIIKKALAEVKTINHETVNNIVYESFQEFKWNIGFTRYDLIYKG